MTIGTLMTRIACLCFTSIPLMCIPQAICAQSTCLNDDEEHLSNHGACICCEGTATGIRIDQPFAMHSIMKFPQAIYVAECLKNNNIALSNTITVRKEELMQYTWSPMLQMFSSEKDFSYAELLELSLAQSDNNACDILFKQLGGPDKVEDYLHKLGFTGIHIKWTEREMGINPCRAADNNCTPKDMARLAEWLYLNKEQNEYLRFVYETMANCKTGAERISSVIPEGSTFVHKTGTGFPSKDKVQDRNDVGIILLPDGQHVCIAVFVPDARQERDVATIAQECLMRTQADAFLKHMTPNLQHTQTLAIIKAMDGDNSDLEAVRQSRNAEPQYADNVQTRMITPTMRIYEPKHSHEKSLPVMLYLHGGGWTFGSINSCGRFCNAMAASGAMRVIALDYRLAPEHPYPMALNDCIAALQHIISHSDELHIDTNRITLGGDSSGGNLALATALSKQHRGSIESLLLFYPVTKAFDDGSTSWQLYGKGYGLDAEIMETFNRAYTMQADSRCTAISVGLCSDDELRALPRTLLIAAERDILCDQGRELASRMGSKATRIEYKGAVHLFITVPGQDAAFQRAVKDAVAYITQCP